MVRKRTIAGLAGFAGLMALIPWSAQADQVFLDDVIVDGSLCVGIDCSNGESFGFDTIRLKENNLRINFEDTSASASFPTNDWQLQANESSNGGKNWFTILDDDLGRRLFTVRAGAPNNAIFLDQQGDLGLNTDTPAVEFEIRDGDSPTVRLNQDGSSGFTPQTWDLAGNETNFFVRDVTNGSRLPFRIRPSAPTDSLYVDTDGDIGLGTDSPAAAVHSINDKAVGLQLERTSTGSVAVQLRNSDNFWNITLENTTGSLLFNTPGGSTELTLDQSGNLTVSGNITCTGTVGSVAC